MFFFTRCVSPSFLSTPQTTALKSHFCRLYSLVRGAPPFVYSLSASLGDLIKSKPVLSFVGFRLQRGCLDRLGPLFLPSFSRPPLFSEIKVLPALPFVALPPPNSLFSTIFVRGFFRTTRHGQRISRSRPSCLRSGVLIRLFALLPVPCIERIFHLILFLSEGPLRRVLFSVPANLRTSARAPSIPACLQ